MEIGHAPIALRNTKLYLYNLQEPYWWPRRIFEYPEIYLLHLCILSRIYSVLDAPFFSPSPLRFVSTFLRFEMKKYRAIFNAAAEEFFRWIIGAFLDWHGFSMTTKLKNLSPYINARIMIHWAQSPRRILMKSTERLSRYWRMEILRRCLFSAKMFFSTVFSTESQQM